MLHVGQGLEHGLQLEGGDVVFGGKGLPQLRDAAGLGGAGLKMPLQQENALHLRIQAGLILDLQGGGLLSHSIYMELSPL